MTNVIVTGSSGFIGQHLVKELIKCGYKVKGIDITDPKISLLKFDFEYCDLMDQEKLLKVLGNFEPEILFHLAAKTDLNEKAKLDYYNANIKGVENLITAINRITSIKRCIFTSSQLVCRVGYVPNDDLDYNPNTLYGQSKVMTEKIVRANNGGGVPWCIVRPTTVWGPGMSPHYQRLFQMIKSGKYFHVGNSPLYKSYGYIGNITYQYLQLINAPLEQINQKVFYLADYEPLSLRQWTNTIQKELEAKPIKSYPLSLVEYIAKIGDVINFLGWKQFPFNSFRLNNVITEYVFNMTDTQKVCGNLPYTMEEGVKELVNWMKAENLL